ncbi:MAG: O-antigen ligase family protein [Niabella sp.]
MMSSSLKSSGLVSPPVILTGIFSLSGLLKDSYWFRELPPFIFCSLAAVLMLVALWGSKAIVFTGIDAVVFLFFFYTILSSVVKAYPYPVTDRVYFIIGGLFLFTAFRLSMAKPLVVQALYGFLIIMAVQATWGILQFFTGYKVTGGFGNGAVFGCFMAMGFVLIVCDILYRKHPTGRTVIMCFAGVVVAAALFLSLSRAACITSIAGIGFAALCKRYVWTFLKRRAVTIVGVLIVCTGILYYLWQLNTTSVSGRFLIWKIGVKMFADKPVLGIGYGNFFTEYGNYQARYFLSGAATEQEALTAGMNYHAFNEFLKVAIEGGLLGLLLFVLMLLLIFRKGLLLIKAGNSKAVIPLTLLITIIVFGMASYPLQDISVSVIFFFCIAYVAALPATEGKKRELKLYPGIKVALLLFAGFGALRCTQKVYALCTWHTAKEFLLSREGEALEQYLRIYPLLSNNGAFLFNYGAELAELKEHAQSNKILKRAAMYGNSIELYTALADNYAALGGTKQAEECYIHVAYMVPKKFIPFNNLFNFYKAAGQTGKAIELSGLLCNKPVKVPAVVIDRIKANACTYYQKYKTGAHAL